MSSRKTATRRGTTKKRAQRATSNVFAMFNQDQIQEFKVLYYTIVIDWLISRSIYWFNDGASTLSLKTIL